MINGSANGCVWGIRFMTSTFRATFPIDQSTEHVPTFPAIAGRHAVQAERPRRAEPVLTFPSRRRKEHGAIRDRLERDGGVRFRQRGHFPSGVRHTGSLSPAGGFQPEMPSPDSVFLMPETPRAASTSVE
jgi:hypothetical protein